MRKGLSKIHEFGGRKANEEALRLFSGAIELDPDFASAYGHAASCYADAKAYGWLPGSTIEIDEVSRLIRRAIELGKDDAQALAASGWALAYVARDLEAASALIDRALALNSNMAVVWLRGGWVKNWLGEPKTAIERFTRAMRLSPLGLEARGIKVGTAHAFFFLGRYDEAASSAAIALQENLDLQPALRISAACHAMAGRPEQADQAVARLRQVNPKLRVSNLIDVLGPYRRAQDISQYQEALRKAGLPE